MTDDVMSYQFRIAAQEMKAERLLACHDYDSLLASVARLIALREALREVEYQESKAEVLNVGE